LHTLLSPAALKPSWETVAQISNRTAEVIRNQYTIGYSPSNQTLDKRLRLVEGSIRNRPSDC
jgi:hypothetical protein